MQSHLIYRKLWQRGVVTNDIPFAVAMRCALEMDNLEKDTRRRECYMALVTDWVKLAGDEITERIMGKEGKKLTAPGPVYMASARWPTPGLTRARWNNFRDIIRNYAYEDNNIKQIQFGWDMEVLPDEISKSRRSG